jgi:hypothetical protein
MHTKSQDGNVERIRILRLTRRSAVVAQGQASNQMHALIATAPDELRDQLRDLTTRKRVEVAAAARNRVFFVNRDLVVSDECLGAVGVRAVMGHLVGGESPCPSLARGPLPNARDSGSTS